MQEQAKGQPYSSMIFNLPEGVFTLSELRTNGYFFFLESSSINKLNLYKAVYLCEGMLADLVDSVAYRRSVDSKVCVHVHQHPRKEHTDLSMIGCHT